jgi:hypothetical protein
MKELLMLLKDMQTQFKENIINTELNDLSEKFVSYLKCDDIDAKDRLSVYNNNLLTGLSDVLAKTFPITKKLVGEDFFHSMVLSYIPNHLPKQACLHEYGNSLPDFIKRYKHARSLPYLGDVAKMEWAWNEAYYAPDEKPLNTALLKDIDDEKLGDLGFSFISSAKLIKSKYPLFEIREFCMTTPADGELDINQNGSNLLIVRPSLTVHTIKIEDAEYRLLKLLYEGNTINNAAALTLSNHPDYDIGQTLQKHFELGSFSDFEIME